MKAIEKMVLDLGCPYQIKNIDMEDVIYRKLDTGYEFEVSGLPKKVCTLYVWSTDPSEIVGIYGNIPTESLKDVLGYYAVRYRNLLDHIQVERQDKEV